MALFTQNRHKLVHDAAGHSSMSVFSLLTGHCLCYLIPIICGGAEIMFTKDESI